MRTILIKCTLIWFLSLTAVLSVNAQEMAVAQMKNWQVKGLAKSAMRHHDYFQARYYLTEWAKRQPDNTEALFLLGNAYEFSRDYAKASEIYYSLHTNHPKIMSASLYRYALMQKSVGRYEVAIDAFESVRRQPKKLTKYGVTKKMINDQLTGCRMALAYRDSVVTSEVSRLGATVNWPHMEFAPLLVDSGHFVYASSVLDSVRYLPLDGKTDGLAKLYEATLVDDEWIGGNKPEPPIVDLHGFESGKGTFSLDKNRYYATYCAPNLDGKMICHLYMSRKDNQGKWSSPQKMGPVVNHRKFSSWHPTVGTCFNPVLEVLYFVSDRPGGAGGQDIWFSVYNTQKEVFTRAQNAGVFINTNGEEVSPFYDLTSHKLFFSSTGWPGMGGFDVFSAKGDLVMWDQPVNIGVPVNASSDDLDFVQNESGKSGFLTSNRAGSAFLYNQGCCDDIYSFTQTGNPRIYVTGKLFKAEQTEGRDIFRKVDSKSAVLPQSFILKNKAISISAVTDSSSMVFLKETVTDEQGGFAFWAEPGQDYEILVEDSTLMERAFAFSTKEIGTKESLDLEVAPLMAVPEKPIVIDNIYYEFNQTELSQQAQAAIDSTVLLLLRRYPATSIEIGSHTDDVGDARYNLRLSEKRSAGVVSYLIKKGIDASRLIAKGYGETVPIAPNRLPSGEDSPEGRQKNRRTEIKVKGNVQR